MLSTLLLLSLSDPARLEDERDWPRWRGTHSDDRAHVQGVFARPFRLEPRWRARTGSGYASVTVLGDVVVTLGARDGEDFAFALERASGAERWRTSLGPTYAGQDGAVDGPCSTPTLADGTAFVLTPRGTLLALALADGKARWSRDLAAEDSAPRPHWGFTTAPLCTDGLVIVAAGAPGGRAFLAFSMEDGALRWSHGEALVHYQSPQLVELDGERLVLASGTTHLFALEPRTGKERLHVPHAARDFYEELLQPVALGDGRFLLEDRAQGASAVRLVPGARAPEPLWTTGLLRQNYSASVQAEGLLFGHASSSLVCLDAETGDLLWRSRQPGDGFEILVDDQLVLLTKQGSLHVAPASPEGYEERAALALFEDQVWAPPAFAHGSIFARSSAGELACIDVVPLASDTRAARESQALSQPGTLRAALEQRLAAAANPGAVVDEFLAEQPAFPVVEQGRIVHFFFRGAAQEMAVRGDFLEDTDQLDLTRLAGTDLFHAALELAPDARVGYQFVRDFDEPLADPLNPRTTPSLTLAGPVSVLCMPAADALAPPPPAAARGRSEELTLEAPRRMLDGRPWGGLRRVWVYLPPGYDQDSRRYPVLYVNEGNGARGALDLFGLLDDLAIRQPCIAVLAETLSGYELARTDATFYRDFLADVVVREIDARFRTLPAREQRAVLGWDEGAYAALFAAFTRGEVFGAALSLSLYHGSRQGEDELDALAASAAPLPRVWLDWGRYDARDRGLGLDTARASRRMAAALAARGAAPVTHEAADGDQVAFWRCRLPRLLTEWSAALPQATR